MARAEQHWRTRVGAKNGGVRWRAQDGLDGFFHLAEPNSVNLAQCRVQRGTIVEIATQIRESCFVYMGGFYRHRIVVGEPQPDDPQDRGVGRQRQPAG